MQATGTLTDEVRQRVNDRSEDELIFSPAVLEAMRLADAFAQVTPQEYVLPLDALAGFPMANLEKAEV